MKPTYVIMACINKQLYIMVYCLNVDGDGNVEPCDLDESLALLAEYRLNYPNLTLNINQYGTAKQCISNRAA